MLISLEFRLTKDTFLYSPLGYSQANGNTRQTYEIKENLNNNSFDVRNNDAENRR